MNAKKKGKKKRRQKVTTKDLPGGDRDVVKALDGGADRQGYTLRWDVYTKLMADSAKQHSTKKKK